MLTGALLACDCGSLLHAARCVPPSSSDWCAGEGAARMSDNLPEPQHPANPDELPNSVGEVQAEDARLRRVGSAWTGFLLTGVGFLVFICSYFLLPVLVVVFCLDCGPEPRPQVTAWETSLRVLSFVQVDRDQSLILMLVFILLCYLPLLAAVAALGCSIGFLVHPHRTFATWNHRVWLAGISALGIAFPFLFWFVRPDIGYVGMLFGYGLIWGGNRLFLTAYP